MCWGQGEHSQHRCTNLPSRPKKKKILFPRGWGVVVLKWILAVIRELMLEKCARSGVAQHFSRGALEPACLDSNLYLTLLFCSPVKGAS